MTINGFALPVSFVEAIERGAFKRRMGSWSLREEQDAYEHPLETELGGLWDTAAVIAKATAELPTDFEPDGFYGDNHDWEDEPGFIPDIIDFSAIVCFGISGDGAPFCFDFRDDKNNPSVIWWDDCNWRRVAPDFDAFVNLFTFSEAAS